MNDVIFKYLSSGLSIIPVGKDKRPLIEWTKYQSTIAELSNSDKWNMPIALVAGIDRLTDGFKTVVNIIGNSVNAIILSHWEAEQVPEAEQIPVR